MTTWRDRNPEKYKELQRSYRQRNKDKIREHQARFRSENRDLYLSIQRRGHLRAKFGLEMDDYEKLLKKQRGRCAICRKPEIGKRLAIDHCHKTNVVRGLLCSKCNRGLGHFDDNLKYLTKAVEYLKESKRVG